MQINANGADAEIAKTSVLKLKCLERVARENRTNSPEKEWFARHLKVLKHLEHACLGEPIYIFSLKTGWVNAHPAWPAPLPLIKVVMGRKKGP